MSEGVFDPIKVDIQISTAPQKAEFLRRYCVVSDGDTNVTQGEYAVVSGSDWVSKFGGSPESKLTYKWLKSFFINAIGKTAVIYECKGSNATDKMKDLEKFIDEKKYPCYNFSVPTSWLSEAYFQTLLTKYSNPNNNVHFSAVVADSQDPTTEGNYTKWKGQASFMAYFPSLADQNLNIDGLISGIKASSKFDITLANPMSSLEYKEAQGVSKVLGATLEQKCLQAPTCITKETGGKNVVRNAKYADGSNWHYIYSKDNLVSMLQANITALMLNASNSTGGAIPFNDSGIQTIKSNLIATLNTARQMGIVNRFASKIDLATGALIDENDIATVPFVEYKQAQGDDYKNGFYNGYSAYVEILEFIVQIQFNINLG